VTAGAGHQTRAWAGALVVALVLIGGLGLVLAGVHTSPRGYRGGPPTVQPGLLGGPAPGHPRPSVASQSPAAATNHASLPGWLYGTVLFGTFGLIFALVVMVIMNMGRPEWRWRAGRHADLRRPGGVAAPDLPRRLAEAVDRGLGDLADGTVADAIVACWLRVHRSAVAAGVAPVRSDTPEDFVQRVLRSAHVRLAPLEKLAELYREARFSRHVMSEADRGAARAALEDISRDLLASADA
jgi:hypothetical protein